MLAIILIGGKGTRLRPFTCRRPKPLLPLVNKPFLEYQLEALKAHGVREVILCTSYLPGQFRSLMGDGRRLGLRLRYVHEKRPLGTGGAVKNCERHVDGPFLVFNGDILSSLDITDFVRRHRRSGAEASIALARVKDPTLYGLVETDPSGAVRSFLEKPAWDEIRTNTINAGAYLFEPGVLRGIPPETVYSLERGLFPDLLARKRRLLGYVSRGYWLDIGTVDKYLQAHLDILSGAARLPRPAGGPRGLAHGRGVRLGRDISWAGKAGLTVLGDGVAVGDFARFAGHVCVGNGCVIGQGAQLEDCVVLDGTRVGEGASLKRCIVGARCRIGAHAAIGAGGAVADGSVVGAYSAV